MRTEDISSFKGQIKSVLQQWGNNKIDNAFPGGSQIKAFAKNGLNNILVRMDAKLNKYIDGLVLFAGNEKGEIDTDTIVDMAVEMFKEMEPHKYQFEMVDVMVGKGELVLHFPPNVMFDLLFGGLKNLRFTADDLLELKEMFNS